MRVVRYMSTEGPSIGVVVGDGVHPIHDENDRPVTSLAAFLKSSDASRDDLPALDTLSARRNFAAATPLEEIVMLAPITDPGKIVAIGLNYRGYVGPDGREEIPIAPLVFAKFPSAIIGPGEAISWSPTLTQAVDYEAELAVVIGRRARNVSVEDALSHVFGYMCLNDVSARDLQFGDGQWVRGKSLDTFCPIGPWIVTADEVPDPQSLAIGCTISGEVMQAGTTGDMYFSVAEVVSLLSQAFTLDPGDIVSTGSPAGVGWFRNPRRLLRDGDHVTVSIELVGELDNPVRVSTEQASG